MVERELDKPLLAAVDIVLTCLAIAGQISPNSGLAIAMPVRSPAAIGTSRELDASLFSSSINQGQF